MRIPLISIWNHFCPGTLLYPELFLLQKKRFMRYPTPATKIRHASTIRKIAQPGIYPVHFLAPKLFY